MAEVSATRSWLARESLRTRRPAQGRRHHQQQDAQHLAITRLVTTSMTSAPRP